MSLELAETRRFRSVGPIRPLSRICDGFIRANMSAIAPHRTCPHFNSYISKLFQLHFDRLSSRTLFISCSARNSARLYARPLPSQKMSFIF